MQHNNGVYSFSNGWSVLVGRSYSTEMWSITVRNPDGAVTETDVIFKDELKTTLDAVTCL